MNSNTLRQQVLSIIQNEGKLVAVKFYYEEVYKHTGERKSLAESKLYVDELCHQLDSNTEQKSSNNFKNELLDLISKGQAINAIKIYRDRTNVSLKEAKEYIEQLINQTDFNHGKENTPSQKESTSNPSKQEKKPTPPRFDKKKTDSNNGEILLIAAIGAGLVLLIYFLLLR